jgi:circadian clock protein KaiC
MVDCVVLLHHRLADRVSLRGLRVVKYRGSSFAANEFPLTIGPAGIEVAGPDVLRVDIEEGPEQVVFLERVSTGVERLDTMLSSGYYRGTSVLISGSPGTAKSTLCGAFAVAGCRRGERTLYVSFDETAGEVVRNLDSVGIRLEPHLRSGLLRIHSARTESRSAEEHMMTLRTLIHEFRPSNLVIDPLSAMIQAGGDVAARSVAHRLLFLTKQAGITLICTSLLEAAEGQVEAAEIPISTMADTWIHLSYVVRGGERNRSLSIVKSRGTRHSNQVRELILGDSGVTLADVYTAGGDVLMGTARWERERQQEYEQGRLRAEVERKRRELALAEAEVQARIEALQRELEARKSDLALLLNEQETRGRENAERHRGLLAMRRADRNSH